MLSTIFYCHERANHNTGRGVLKEAYINHLSDHVGEEVIIKGWLYNKRAGGKIRFLLVRDGTGLVQCVMVKGEVEDEIFDICDQIGQESSLVVTGKVGEDQRAPGGFEIQITGLTIVQACRDYPITPKSHGTTFLLDHRHLWLRSRRQQWILRIRDELIKSIRDYFYEREFVLIDTPILTGAIGETASTLFDTEYFHEGKAYLAQTGQLYVEAAAAAFGKVYCFGPTFRAEKSKTRRHLTEFWMVEAEVAFLDSSGNMDLQEDFVCSVIRQVIEKRERELKELERDISLLEKIKPPFPRISYDEALTTLSANGKEMKWGEDFGADEETVLSEQFDQPVFVYNYPREIKAFYMPPDPEKPEVVLCNDLLAPEGYGEIIGGSQRTDDLEILRSRIREKGLPEEGYGWYLDLRRYGTFPHSGFGLGVERLLAWICGLNHLREAIPFPRTITRLTP
jgi:asparaginyl-tRNA synthetase